MNKQFSIYKPQPFEKDGQYQGAAISVQLGDSPKGKAVYMSLVKQKSWNAETKQGSFYSNKDEGQSSRVKFNETEIGGLIHAIRTYGKFSAFHSFDDDKTQISFGPYSKKDGSEAFTLTVTKNGLKIGLGIEKSEAEVLRVFFESALTEMFEKP